MTTITTLASYVESKRLELGIPTQTALARIAGIPRETVNRIEAGKTQNPEADVRRRLAKALGVSHVDLLIAAGELTKDEVQAAGAVGVIERDADPDREAIIEKIRTLPRTKQINEWLAATISVAANAPK